MICYPEIKELIKNVNLADQESIKDFVYNINKIADKINSRDENEKEKLLLKEELKKIRRGTQAEERHLSTNKRNSKRTA